MTVHIRYEQAVYGSFPFRDQGYDLLAHSPGCAPEWLDWLKAVCPRLAPPPHEGTEGALSVLRPDRDTWAIIGASERGADDRGRPGAIAFHALFLTDQDYRRTNGDPFPLMARFRFYWGPDDHSLTAETAEVTPSPQAPLPVKSLAYLVKAIQSGCRVRLPATSPMNERSQQVWQALPRRVRCRATLATWTVDRDLDCDLIAGPFPNEVVIPPKRRRLVPLLLLSLCVLCVSVVSLTLPKHFKPTSDLKALKSIPRYRGPWLTAEERGRLARDDDPEARRALLWDALIHQFAADRPLPADFDHRPRHVQLQLLAWSLHVEAEPGTSDDEILKRLEELTAYEGPTRPGPLADEYPTLVKYAQFLVMLRSR